MGTRLLSLGLAAALAVPALARANATITIVDLNADQPGVGFNDTTPATPVGGNTATTRGAQARAVFELAATIWGRAIDSNVPIRIETSFQPLFCTATSAVLGSAGPLFAFRNFPGAELENTWYHVALANKLAHEEDLAPGGNDIRARFNSILGDPNCLDRGGADGWYLGFDGNEGPNQTDLLAVLLHEFGHGLGFSSLANVVSGQLFLGKPDVYSKYYYDVLLGKGRLDMNNPERRFSAVNTGNVVWSGDHVTANVETVLAKTPFLDVTFSDGKGVRFPVGEGSFSGPLTQAGITGEFVIPQDAVEAGGTATDGCTPPYTNGADLAGKIALVDRGLCGFNLKAAYAQLYGAIAVVVVDNRPAAAPPGMAGAPLLLNPIPAISILQADGAILKAQLTGTTGKIWRDPAFIAGANSGQAKLYAPNPVEPGSSISHWDTSASPNQLMEPFINSDLTAVLDANPNGGGDLTMSLFRDIGWYPDANLDRVRDDVDRCPAADPAPTVVIGGVDTGVPNTTLVNGCTISQRVTACDAGTHGAFLSCVTALADELEHDGYLAPNQKSALVDAAAGTN
jgi:hypothetical protein